MKNLKLIGTLSLVVGGITAVLAFIFPPLSMMTAIAGFILSSIYISILTRHNEEVKLLNPGYISLLLSSTPLLLFLIGPMLK